MRAVPTDNRARRWKPHPESQWELVYSCARGQVDWHSPDGKPRNASLVAVACSHQFCSPLCIVAIV